MSVWKAVFHSLKIGNKFDLISFLLLLFEAFNHKVDKASNYNKFYFYFIFYSPSLSFGFTILEMNPQTKSRTLIL